jgi:hypothetical protein
MTVIVNWKTYLTYFQPGFNNFLIQFLFVRVCIEIIINQTPAEPKIPNIGSMDVNPARIGGIYVERT